MDNMDTRSKCSRLKLPAIKEVKDDVELFAGIRQRRNVLSEMLKHTNDKSIYKEEEIDPLSKSYPMMKRDIKINTTPEILPPLRNSKDGKTGITTVRKKVSDLSISLGLPTLVTATSSKERARISSNIKPANLSGSYTRRISDSQVTSNRWIKSFIVHYALELTHHVKKLSVRNSP